MKLTEYERNMVKEHRLQMTKENKQEAIMQTLNIVQGKYQVPVTDHFNEYEELLSYAHGVLNIFKLSRNTAKSIIKLQ